MSEELKNPGNVAEASRQFIIKISIFTLIIAALSTALFLTILNIWYLSAYPYMIILIAAVTTIGHLLVVKASIQNSRRFATAFLASVTLKLMIYLTFILAYLLNDHSKVVPFVLTFIILYILYTIFEVVQILNFIKRK